MARREREAAAIRRASASSIGLTAGRPRQPASTDRGDPGIRAVARAPTSSQDRPAQEAVTGTGRGAPAAARVAKADRRAAAPRQSGILVRPELRVGWQHEYGDATFGFASSLPGGAGREFVVHGPATGRDSLIVNAGVAIEWNERFSTYVYYDGELARANYEAASISGGCRFEF